jgi:hypothetical protein
MNWFQKLLTLLSAVILVTVLGCAAWMEGLTPAYVDPAAIEYADTEPTVLPIPGYVSLWDARRIKRELDFAHLTEQIRIARDLEDDQMRYKHLQDAMQINIASAEELRNTLFSSTGPLSILFAAVPALGLGAYLIQRPSDRKKITELENGKTTT